MLEAHGGRADAIRLGRSFVAMALLLVAAFLLGGGSRGDIASLIILRPVAVLLLAFGLWRLTWAQVRDNRFLFGMALAIILLELVHLVPMPPAVWGQLPGRDIVAEIERTVKLGEVWRPLTLTPDAGRNAFFATLVPLAALVLGVQLQPRERMLLLPLILIVGGTSALLGVLQILGDPHAFLYFYEITNSGSAVGLFSNRNHQALLLALMLPMLATFSYVLGNEEKGSDFRKFVAILGAFLIIPLILITGSRLGIMVAVLGLLSIPVILRRPPAAAIGADQTQVRPWIGLVVVLAAAVLALITIFLGRAQAWERLVATDPLDEQRIAVLPLLLDLSWLYFPLGSGIGSFERIFRVHETDALLAPSYLNHAHNDWLELVLTGGLPAAILLAVAVIAFSARAVPLFFREAAPTRTLKLARLGLVVIFLMGIASFSEYPLRTPSLACLFVVATLWASGPLLRDEAIAAPDRTYRN